MQILNIRYAAMCYARSERSTCGRTSMFSERLPNASERPMTFKLIMGYFACLIDHNDPRESKGLVHPRT